MRNVLLVVALTLVPAAAPTGAAPAPQDPEAAVDALFAGATGGDAPGAAVLVARDGRILVEKAYGLASLELRAPNTPETRFRIGSVTKPFTAMAVLMLYEAGRLNLDETVAQHLPDYPHGARITIRQLLSHTSGLPDFVSIDESGRLPLESEPGTRLNYSNTGYGLLGRIIERTAGQPYAEFLQARLFAPLGMTDTGVDIPRSITRGRAAGYLRDGSGALVNAPQGDFGAEPFAGGLSSTVRDLYRFVRGLEDGAVLRPATVTAAWTPVTLPPGRAGAYGLGWMIGSFRGLREIAHGGDIEGFNAWLAVYPDAGATIIVLSNLSMHAGTPLPPAAQLGHRLALLYLADVMEPQEAIPVSLAPEVLDRHAGRYRLEAPRTVLDIAGEELTIVREGSQLFARDRTMTTPLVAASATVFTSTLAPVTITFLVDGEGRTREALLSFAGLREFRAIRID